jgi:hypothetical protein
MATHDETSDQWIIEPDDLFRTFPVAYHIQFVLEAVEPLREGWDHVTACEAAKPQRPGADGGFGD